MILNIETHIVYDSNGNYIEEYRICPNCKSKNYPIYVKEYDEEMYNCICQKCKKVLYDLFFGENNKINYVIKTHFIDNK